jgi:hypothetical protein
MDWGESNPLSLAGDFLVTHQTSAAGPPLAALQSPPRVAIHVTQVIQQGSSEPAAISEIAPVHNSL